MGVCFSKKKKPVHDPPPNEDSSKIEAQPSPNKAPVVEKKKQVFVITQTPKKSSSGSTSAAAASEDSKEKEKPKKSDAEPISNVFVALPKPDGPIQTSSCTKEEVDAILIQCGRLSRSSSAGKASNDRKYSGSKRSYDFDNEKPDEADWVDNSQASRPSPRRRTPNRERSGSRERGSQRKVSRSPGRRSDGPAASKPLQPAKMVSVPAREKGVTTSNRRNASPRSRSPANNGRVSNENAAVTLSRSSSRKAEQSPLRRNPMAEIDDNNRTHKPQAGQIQTQKSNCVRDQLMNCRAKEKQTEPERTITRTRSSRRSSRDFDNILGLNPDIHNFSLPACVTKACSILEAVADLNSSSSDQSRRRGLPFVESEVAVKDDLMEPRMHKYVSVRDIGGGEAEPQESAGSNSVVGQPWPPLGSPTRPIRRTGV